jgi:hypothetical protein
METIEWRDIPEYRGYYKVSNTGYVMSFKGKTPIILKAGLVGKKRCQYLAVNLCKNGVFKSFKIHKLVAEVFMGHKSDGTTNLVIDHIDTNRLNNNLKNLKIISNRENLTKDRVRASKYRYVYWHKQAKKWIARFNYNHKIIYLGLFYSELEAHNKCKQYILLNNLKID